MSTENPRVLAVPRLEVMLDDGRTLEVQALNPDLLRYDRTAAKHGWPKIEAAPFLWLTFLAWSALRRTGEIPEAMGWTEFADERCLQVRNLDAGNGTGPIEMSDPTLPVPELG